MGTPAYTPKFMTEATEDANIPMWQPNGTVKYVSQTDFDWLIANGKIDMPQPESVKVD